ncbi:MFS transporter [Arcanobacterium phocae]|uniref:MFS transporter n=1 Tax=Arcanobacterium phocae TaxID=131112 RepID=UPI001C0F6A6B|nr:MFS transporter [Arcanobacterium phocae]
MYPVFRRLLTVRLISQTADGLFQAGLATLVLFNPYYAATPAEVALGFAVILLPFTFVVPFVGPLLDRWNRRRVLVTGNLVRAGIILLLAGIVASFPQTRLVFLGALIVLGINRFILAALSAGLPHTLPQRLLVIANSIVPTVGSIATGLGALAVFVVSVVIGPWQHVTSLILAALCCVGAGFTAMTMSPNSLGPTYVRTWSIQNIVVQLSDGIRYLMRQRTPALALSAMAVHRLLYGISMMMVLFASREIGGMALFGTLLAVSFAGNALAIVVTPLAHRFMTSLVWIVVCSGLGAVAHVIWWGSFSVISAGIGCVLLGLSVQGIKIAVDTIVQRDTADAYRGRAFSIYDMLFNMAFVAAGIIAAFILPDMGWSAAVCVGCALTYGVFGFIYASVVLCSSRLHGDLAQ